MIYILIVCMAAALLFALVRRTNILADKTSEINPLCLAAVMGAFSVVYLVASAAYLGHKTDMSCFSAWSDMIFKDGIRNFYTSDAFHDYPPGYMYVLYFIGALKSLFGISGTAETVLLKIPSLACNLGSGYIIYKIAKNNFGTKASVWLCALYLFNPAVITNGALWGQVDAVYTFTVMCMIYLITQKRMIASYFMFALCILIKPQSLIFTPVLILGIAENLFINNFDIKNIVKNLLCGLGAILALVPASAPFGLKNVTAQYVTTIADQYPYFTINAFNLWGVLGMNWKELTTAGSAVGGVFIVLIVLYSAYVFLKSKNSSKYWYTAALLAFLTYMLSVKMHDRYSFPAMLLMLAAFAVNKDIKTYLLYALLSITHFFNEAWILFIYDTDPTKYFQSPVFIAASAVNIMIALYMIYTAYSVYVKNKIENRPVPVKKEVKRTVGRRYKFRLSEKAVKITKFDIIAMLVITAVYGGIALYDLGDMKAPETETMITSSPATIDLGADTEISKLRYFLGAYNLDETRELGIDYISADGENVKTDTVSEGAVFYWNESEADVTARYITLWTDAENLSIKEMGVIGTDGTYVTPQNAADGSIAAMFDEQTLIPERATFRNGTYFDEIYHARTAYEFIHHSQIYEWTHPPLGKLIIALGIMIFGMCPFGWRIAGTVVGIIMVPVIYLFAKRFFKRSWLAAVTCILFAFDFMHFAQTRIATIDVYVTFFIILMYYFMYRYTQMSFYDTPLKKTLAPLALCGISMGLGIASKWTGVYAGAGLAVIFFCVLIRRYNEYRYALTDPTGETNGISHGYVIKNFKPCAVKTIVWCCIFFVAVPIVIYCLSYIPYMMTPSGNGLKTVTENMRSMYTYHSKTVLGSTHPYSSLWYQWPLMYRPIWYYSGTVSDGLKEGISSFGNPAVWWTGIAAFAYMVYRAVLKRDKNAVFLIIAYLAQLVPWIPVSRLTFIYHYFPSVPFVVLMIGYSLCAFYAEAVTEQGKKTVMYSSFAYAALAVVLFMMFYPVLSGHACTPEYVSHWLRWFPTWALL